MKKTLLIIWILMLPLILLAQVTTIPLTPTDNEEITIIFDAVGTNLEGYTGDVYAFTGVVINSSGGFSNLIGEWGDNTTNPQLTRDSGNSNLYTLIISPTVFDYYGVSSSEYITDLLFVFRSSDSSLQTIPDIFVPINSINSPPIIENWGVVGSATPGGWVGPDLPFIKTDVPNEYIAYVTLTDGEIKFRANNDWSVNYGDTGADGTLESIGGANIAVSAGNYKIVMNLDALTYTIEAYTWGIVGSGTPGGWVGPDLLFMTTDLPNEFIAYVTLTDGEIKFRENNDWSVNYGDTGADGTLESIGGANIPVSAGNYKIVMNLNALTYTIEDYTWGLVGDAINEWGFTGLDIPLTYDATTDQWRVEVTLSSGEFKIRLNNDWEFNYGDTGLDGTLEDFEGANIPISSGYYLITVDFSSLEYSIKSALVSIPDPNFEQALIDLGIDSDGVVNTSILRSDAETVTSLNIMNKGISSLIGIEAFVYLTELFCDSNSIINLDLSTNINLETVRCAFNSMETLIVPNSLTLKHITASLNNLSVLDITQNTELEHLSIRSNNFTSIDISNNLKLINLFAFSNQISSIDVTNHTSLVELLLHNNQISNIDVTKNVNLTRLSLEQNQISDIDISNNVLLQRLTLNNNSLTKLDVSKNPNLVTLSLYINNLTTFDASNNPNLTTLYVDENPGLQHLDLRNGNTLGINDFWSLFTSLTCINVDDETADFSSWNVDPGTVFSNDCGDFVYIPDANFEQVLIDLKIDSDGVVNTSILREDAESTLSLNASFPDVNNNFAHPDISITEKITDLTGLDAFINLIDLSIGYNNLLDIDVSNNVLLEELWVNDNSLTTIDIQANTVLRKFGAMRCNLSGTLNVSQNTSLEELWLHYNNIDAIISSSSPNLWRLAVQNNNLSSLDLINYPNLTYVSCNNNSLSSLDISTNTIINRVDAQYNPTFNLLTDATLGSPTLTSLNLSGTGLSNYNGASYPNIKWLLLNDNNLTRFNGNNALLVENLFLNNNSIGKLVLSSNTMLKQVYANDNVLTELDVRNGKNLNLTILSVTNNILTCISVDNPDDITMPYGSWSIDLGVLLSANCNAEPEVVLIPDSNFELALAAYDSNGINGNILLSEAEAVTSLDVSSASIIDLTGIEGFINLTDLNVSENLLNIINLIENTNLINVDVSANNLNELFVNSGRNLVILNCSDNQISTLNLSGFTDLEVFNGSINLFESIDATSLDLLTSFDVSSNVLTELDMRNGNNTAISLFDARNNLLGCIGVDDETNIPANWFKDLSTNYTNTGDCTAPIVLTQNISVALDRNGTASITASDIDNGTADNVSLQKDLTFSLDITDFSCADLGINTVILTVTDEAGNFNFATADVLVEDLIAPDATALRTFTGDLNGMVAFNLFPEDIDSGSSDNCGISGLTIDQSIFTFPGTYTVILTATDTSGNTSTNVTTVEIIDSVTGSETLKFGKLELTIYPVPFSNVINITFSQATDLNTVSVQLVTMLGVDTGVQFFPDGNGNLISSDTSSLSGPFVLQVAVGSSKTKTATIIGNN